MIHFSYLELISFSEPGLICYSHYILNASKKQLEKLCNFETQLCDSSQLITQTFYEKQTYSCWINSKIPGLASWHFFSNLFFTNLNYQLELPPCCSCLCTQVWFQRMINRNSLQFNWYLMNFISFCLVAFHLEIEIVHKNGMSPGHPRVQGRVCSKIPKEICSWCSWDVVFKRMGCHQTTLTLTFDHQ